MAQHCVTCWKSVAWVSDGKENDHARDTVGIINSTLNALGFDCRLDEVFESGRRTTVLKVAACGTRH